MEALKIDYSFLFSECGFWLQVIVYSLFCYGRVKRWVQLKHISKGFELIGLAQILILAVGLVLMLDGPQNITMMRVLIYGSAFVMDEYSSWYYNRLEVPIEALQNVKPIQPGDVLFVPYRKLLEYLLEEPDEDKPFWRRQFFRSLLIWVTVGLVATFGFYRMVLAYTAGVQDGIKIATKEQKKTEAKTTQAVQEAVVTGVQSVTASIQPIATTLAQGLQKLGAEVKRNRDEYLKKQPSPPRSPTTSPVRLYINQPTPKASQSQTNFQLPGEVRPVPTLRKGRKQAGVFDLNTDEEGIELTRKY